MTTEDFGSIAAEAIEARCAEYPEDATMLGNHDHDDRLSYPTQAAAHRRRSELTRLIQRLDAVDAAWLDPAGLVAAEILRTDAQGELLLLTEIDEPSWNAMRHNPGQAIYSLLSRDFAPLPDRLAS